MGGQGRTRIPWIGGASRRFFMSFMRRRRENLNLGCSSRLVRVVRSRDACEFAREQKNEVDDGQAKHLDLETRPAGRAKHRSIGTTSAQQGKA